MLRLTCVQKLIKANTQYRNKNKLNRKKLKPKKR